MLGANRPANEAMAARLARFGVASDVLDEAEVSRRFPALCTSPFPTYDDEGEELAHGLGELSALHEHGCGHMDPGAVLSDLLGACRREGVDVRFNQRVEAIATSADGERCASACAATSPSATHRPLDLSSQHIPPPRAQVRRRRRRRRSGRGGGRRRQCGGAVVCSADGERRRTPLDASGARARAGSCPPSHWLQPIQP